MYQKNNSDLKWFLSFVFGVPDRTVLVRGHLYFIVNKSATTGKILSNGVQFNLRHQKWTYKCDLNVLRNILISENENLILKIWNEFRGCIFGKRILIVVFRPRKTRKFIPKSSYFCSISIKMSKHEANSRSAVLEKKNSRTFQLIKLDRVCNSVIIQFTRKFMVL